MSKRTGWNDNEASREERQRPIEDFVLANLDETSPCLCAGLTVNNHQNPIPCPMGCGRML